MNFLDRFSDEMRDRIMQAGQTVIVPRGRLLIRRGERGGDMFLIEKGTFEVVDTRSRPEVVLDVAGPGTVVGEMGFVDDAPRMADVRAAEEATVVLWRNPLLNELFAEQPDLGLAFFREVARVTIERLRTISATAVQGGLHSRQEDRRDEDVERRARDLCEGVRAAWLDAEARLRRSPTDRQPAEQIEVALRGLVDQLNRTSSEDAESDASMQQLGDVLSRELQPFLSRTTLFTQLSDPTTAATGDPRPMAHVLRNHPTGEGDLGRLLDAALLRLPTSVGLRRRLDAAARAIQAHAPPDRPLDLMLLNAHTGILLAQVILHLSRAGARVRAIDGNRDALAFLDAGLPSRPANVHLKLVQEDLGALVLGRSPVWHDTQDVVVVNAMLESLPDRLATALLTWVKDHLRPGGLALVMALGPSIDERFIELGLGWPTIRRPARAVARLIADVGLEAEVLLSDTGHPGVLVSGRSPTGT